MSQGYDGAAVMSGKCTGVQEHLRQAASYALLCSHIKFSLGRQHQDFTEFLFTRTFICIYSNYKTTRYLHEQANCTDTWWVCRYAAVSAVCYTYDSILLTMEDVMDGQDRGKVVEAKGRLNRFHF